MCACVPGMLMVVGPPGLGAGGVPGLTGRMALGPWRPPGWGWMDEMMEEKMEEGEEDEERKQDY